MNLTSELSYCNNLANGQCGLTGGSIAGDWRLPNRFELESLLDLEFYNPTLSNAAGSAKWTEDNAFSGAQFEYYLSSTEVPSNTSSAWSVDFGFGSVNDDAKSSTVYVWPVRSGQ